MTDPFPDVPVYVPPHVARPAAPPGPLRGLVMYANDILSIFPDAAFSADHFTFRALRRKVMVVNAPDLVREAFVVHHAALQRKSPQLRQAFEPLIGDGLFTSDGPVWEARRPAVAHIVHLRNTPEFFPVMVEAALEVKARWEAAAGGAPVDVLADLGNLGAEIVSRALFGTALGREHTAEIVAGLADFQRHMDRLNLASLVKLPDWVPRLPRPGATRAIGRIHRVIDGLIDRLMEEGTGGDRRASFVAQMLRSADADGRPFDKRAIRNEAMVTFLAGYETTANTLAWAIHMLSEAPWAQAALAAELGGVLAGRPPTRDDMARLPYTRAVIEETLRLYPPVPLLGREAIGHAKVGPVAIAPDDQVIVAPWLLHRNPKIWPRPDAFVPERFLPGRERPGKYAYIPFAIGPRICPGMMFGLTEAMVSLSLLADAFSFRPVPRHVVKPQSRGTLRPGDTLPVLIERRAPARRPAAPDPQGTPGAALSR